MNTFLDRRRRTERFAQLLDERSGGPRHHVHTDLDVELEALLPVVERVRLAGELGAPAPDFKADLLANLMATIERDGIGVTAQPPERVEPVRAIGGGRRVRLAAIVGLAVGTLAVSSMSMASGDANPGDPLYGVKRSTEKAQLALAGTDVNRGQLYLQFARTRMAEALTVGEDPDALAAVLTDMDDEAKQGVKLLTSAAASRKELTALDAVDVFVTAQRRGLTELLQAKGGNEAAHSRTVSSLGLVHDVEQRSTNLRAVIGCAAGTVLDDLGPIPPASCAVTPTVRTPEKKASPKPSAPAKPAASVAPTAVQPPATPESPTAILPSPPPLLPTGTPPTAGLLDGLFGH